MRPKRSSGGDAKATNVWCKRRASYGIVTIGSILRRVAAQGRAPKLNELGPILGPILTPSPTRRRGRAPPACMGISLAKLWNVFAENTEFKIIMVGLDNAGKVRSPISLLSHVAEEGDVCARVADTCGSCAHILRCRIRRYPAAHSKHRASIKCSLLAPSPLSLSSRNASASLCPLLATSISVAPMLSPLSQRHRRPQRCVNSNSAKCWCTASRRSGAWRSFVCAGVSVGCVSLCVVCVCVLLCVCVC